MLGLATIVLQSLLVAVLARCIYLRYFHPLSNYPGPSLAAVTDLWKFYTYLGGKHHLVEQDLHAKYGHVIRTGPNSLGFSDLSDFNVIYGFNKAFEKGDFYSFGRDSRAKAGSIFTARSDQVHREHRRKVVGPALSTAKVATYEPVISKNVSNLTSRLTEALSVSKNSSSINVAPYIHRYTFDTLAEIIYGEPICSQPYTDTPGSRNVLADSRNISKFAWAGSLLPWLGWLMATRPMVYLTRRPTYDSEGNLTSIAAIVSRTRDLIFANPERALESRQPSILNNYLQVPESDTKRMRPDEMWRECYNLTFAGPGSTAAALTALLYELGTPRGREWCEHIRADLSLDSEQTRRPLSSPVLIAVIRETLRLRAPFPTAFPRSITPGGESAIPGLPAPLPVGTTVSANTYVLGHSKGVWGEDAELWKPERWLTGDESEAKKLEDSFVVFSKGPRGCIGREIAMLMLAEAVASLLEKWNIRAEKEPKGASFLEMQYTECEVGFVQRSKEVK
ncbi:MAG: hypothetical protein Q9187_006023 [Circinaria calcarea]